MSSADTGYIFNIKKFAIHDGPGIRTTIFLQGCSLRCQWCHNPESMPFVTSGDRPVHRNCLRPYYRALPYQSAWKVSADEVLEEIEKDRIFYEESGGGVTFSGGEPLLQPEFLLTLLQQCKSENYHTAVDTSGYVRWDWMEKISSVTDLFLYDLKLIDDRKHRHFTGVSNRTILQNLEKLCRKGERVVPRIPLIPGITDTPENLGGIVRFLEKLPNLKQVDLLPYNQMGEGKYKKLEQRPGVTNLKHQSAKQMEMMTQFFSSAGFTVSLGG